MCNLYSMTRNREAILRLFRVAHNRAGSYVTQSAIFPGYQAPVVRKAADGEREFVVLNWGFVLLAVPLPRAGVISYCEPKGEKPATRYWFSINGDDARPVLRTHRRRTAPCHPSASLPAQPRLRGQCGL
jgi:hypothetical protein